MYYNMPKSAENPLYLNISLFNGGIGMFNRVLTTFDDRADNLSREFTRGLTAQVNSLLATIRDLKLADKTDPDLSSLLTTTHEMRQNLEKVTVGDSSSAEKEALQTSVYKNLRTVQAKFLTIIEKKKSAAEILYKDEEQKVLQIPEISQLADEMRLNTDRRYSASISASLEVRKRSDSSSETLSSISTFTTAYSKVQVLKETKEATSGKDMHLNDLWIKIQAAKNKYYTSDQLKELAASTDPNKNAAKKVIDILYNKLKISSDTEKKISELEFKINQLNEKVQEPDFKIPNTLAASTESHESLINKLKVAKANIQTIAELQTTLVEKILNKSFLGNANDKNALAEVSTLLKERDIKFPQLITRARETMLQVDNIVNTQKAYTSSPSVAQRVRSLFSAKNKISPSPTSSPRPPAQPPEISTSESENKSKLRR
jgi:prophage maintenance system killer protein